jgi:DNA polymerase
MAFIRPSLTLALGATAAFALTRNDAPLAARRSRVEAGLHDGPVLLTWHPAYILRLSDPALQALAREDLTSDLRAALAMARGQVAAGENRPISR